MRTIYIDTENKCHIYNDGTMTAVETDFFDGKCDAFVEGYRCIPEKMTAPWKPYSELAAAQRQYELDRASLEEAYRGGVNSLD